MAAEEYRRDYAILRRDGLVVHTVPVTREEAWWLYQLAYKEIENREAKIRYLEEYGNVLDVEDYLERLGRLGAAYAKIYNDIAGFYEGPEELRERVDGLLERENVSPGARQTVKELLDKIEDFYQEPVEPKPIGPQPVRYLELSHRHVVFECCGDREEVRPMPEWYAYEDVCCRSYYGISVFPDSLWLWRQPSWYVQAVVARRDVSDGDVVAAVANDGAVRGFLRRYGNTFRELLREYEEEMASRGYEDVVRKVKVVLAAADLLNAGRREEGVPA